jgi:hypothetical protein
MKLATRAQAPATITMARANRAPVPPERSMGRSSCSGLPRAMAVVKSTGRQWLTCREKESPRGDGEIRAVSTRRDGHGVGLAMSTCRGLALVWPLAVEMLDGGGEPKLPSKASPMTRSTSRPRSTAVDSLANPP